MINKVLSVQGMPATKSLNNLASLNTTNSTELDPLSSSSGAKSDYSSSKSSSEPKEQNIETKTAAKSSPRAQNTSNKLAPEKEETFKKSLKSAITEKKAGSSEAPSNVKQPRQMPVSSEQDIEIEDSSELMGPQSVAMGMGQIQKNQVVQEPVIETIEGDGEVQAVMKFMQSMQDEFDVSPQELVSVMSAMSAQLQNMQANPQLGQQAPIVGASSDKSQIEKSQVELFQKLGLEGSQIKRAEYLYQNMLKEMAQDSMSNYLKEKDQFASIEVLSPTDLRKRDMSRSIDRMNNSFFMNDVRPPFGKQLQPNVEQAETKQQLDPNSAKSDKKTNDFADGGALVIPAGMEMLDPKSMQVDSSKQQQSRNMDASSQADDSSPVTGLSLAGLAVAAAPSSGSGGEAGFDSSSQDSNSQKSELTKGKSAKIESVTTNASASTSSADANANLGATTTAKTEVSRPGAEAFSLTAAANEVRKNDVRPEDAANVRNLIQGAQVLMRKGGGEMKVQMNPEGLGQVDLKVAVKEGKVDIQILADTADTKRLLEKGMGDLKASLAGHRLEVSNVKVDVSQNTDRDLSQGQSDLSRDQARQFLGQFRDERESMRSFGDLPNLRSYRTSTASQVTPETAKEEAPAAKNSSRLNVIA